MVNRHGRNSHAGLRGANSGGAALSQWQRVESLAVARDPLLERLARIAIALEFLQSRLSSPP